MAKYSKKVMGKEVGDGALYAPPHTMTGKDIGPKEAMAAVSSSVDPNTLAANQYTPNTRSPRVSFGDPGRDERQDKQVSRFVALVQQQRV
jgi:hypothetical protein